MLICLKNFKTKKDIDIKVIFWEIIIRILIIIIHTENFMRNDDIVNWGTDVLIKIWNIIVTFLFYFTINQRSNYKKYIIYKVFIVQILDYEKFNVMLSSNILENQLRK